MRLCSSLPWLILLSLTISSMPCGQVHQVKAIPNPADILLKERLHRTQHDIILLDQEVSHPDYRFHRLY